MKLRKAIILLSATLLVSSLAFIHTASAAMIGDCILSGYAYMGAGSRQSTPDGPDDQKDYFLAQPLEYIYETEVDGVFYSVDMWGYAWLKFDNLSTETVDSAYLALDLLGVGGMFIEDASEEYPATLDIYSPGDIDVADLHGDDEDTEALALRETLKNTLYSGGQSLTGAIVMPENGAYYIDITNIYNDWVTGEADNNGLILVSDSENGSGYPLGVVGAQFASFGNETGNTPYITSVNPVPVPGAVWLLGSGLLGMIGLRRRKG
jgi:hypothetical protein